jgi:MFS family permease
MNDPSAAPARRAAALFILVTVFLDMLSLGIIMPVLPKLVEEFFSGDTAQAAVLHGLMGTAWAFMQFFCSPIQGALSDRFGGRPVVLLSNLGLVVEYFVVEYMVMVLASIRHSSPSCSIPLLNHFRYRSVSVLIRNRLCGVPMGDLLDPCCSQFERFHPWALVEVSIVIGHNICTFHDDDTQSPQNAQSSMELPKSSNDR